MTVISGVVGEGYTSLGTVTLGTAGYGLFIDGAPPLPLNPYYGYTFPVLVDSGTGYRFAGEGRKLFRDGVIVIPPYTATDYEVIAIFSGNGIGLDWYLQY